MQQIAIVQVGLGGVGRELARQLTTQQAAVAARYGVRLEYLALADASGLLHTGEVLDSAAVLTAVEAKAAGQALVTAPGGTAGLAWSAALPGRPVIVVDVTAADDQAEPLVAAVAAGHRVVLANKRPMADAWAHFQALTAAGAARYEATVGAGLPVISTLQALLDSGDTLLRIEAALSGTLGFLASELERGTAFAAAVRDAHARGYTEPDPRDDLSGADVARKALILARTCGLAWEADAVPPEALFPAELAAVSRDEFMARLDELDAPMHAQVAAARERGEVLRYVATITPEGAGVGLRSLPVDHPLAGLRGADNLISFTTARYNERPLVVRGPGAGLAVTAAGVLGDIIATAREL
jgi:homoserine dehydrogenase